MLVLSWLCLTRVSDNHLIDGLLDVNKTNNATCAKFSFAINGESPFFTIFCPSQGRNSFSQWHSRQAVKCICLTLINDPPTFY
ncbi:hypothetical protein Smp_148780 [Schistosoma mansoni]|uniref:hypothetical protein n=1 Tax=Schistosoma mansoni TaxID=6183 RepID=UPI0001A63ACC|nr:hypothetical protein Smp_148780 [Schistosoma mansoni]|eukprot:XP_018645685.1 hypothetical protein Smp_148780 [Schistosoma mansoni]